MIDAMSGRLPSSRPPSHLNDTAADRKVTGSSTPGRRVSVVDRSKVDPQVVQVAEGMETMFLDYMMKIMRQSVPKEEGDLESAATGIYRNLLDSEYAQKAAHAGGIGLADQIIAYLDSQRYDGNRPKKP